MRAAGARGRCRALTAARSRRRKAVLKAAGPAAAVNDQMRTAQLGLPDARAATFGGVGRPAGHRGEGTAPWLLAAGPSVVQQRRCRGGFRKLKPAVTRNERTGPWFNSRYGCSARLHWRIEQAAGSSPRPRVRSGYAAPAAHRLASTTWKPGLQAELAGGQRSWLS